MDVRHLLTPSAPNNTRSWTLAYHNAWGKNFGDQLAPLILRKLIPNVRLIDSMSRSYSSKGTKGTIACLGSILHHMKPGTTICGIGAISPHKRVPSGLHVSAVRGPGTVRLLRKHGYQIPDNIPMGDLALLIPRLIPEWRVKCDIIHDVVCIPHHNDVQHWSAINCRLKKPIFTVLCSDGVDTVIQTIQSARRIISSSLHGIIVAECLGKPATWLQLPKSKQSETSFKYLDYYESTGRKDVQPCTTIEQAIQYSPKPALYDDSKLMNALVHVLHSRCAPCALKHVARVHTSKNSIFYSFVRDSSGIVGFGRQHYRRRLCQRVRLNNLRELTPFGTNIQCEDPRCFLFQGRLYAVDNYINDVHLWCNEKRVKIQLSGKNFSFVPTASTLYVIHTMSPFILYSLDVTSGKVKLIHRCLNESKQHKSGDADDDDDFSPYRGGTPGYPVPGMPNLYYGLGHKTYKSNKKLHHDVFAWVLNLHAPKPIFTIHDMQQPSESMVITDPTCILDGKYAFTAESEFAWFRDQEYRTQCYKLVFDE